MYIAQRDSREFTAKVVGRDPKSDIAVGRVDDVGRAELTRPFEFARRDDEHRIRMLAPDGDWYPPSGIPAPTVVNLLGGARPEIVSALHQYAPGEVWPQKAVAERKRLIETTPPGRSPSPAAPRSRIRSGPNAPRLE